MKYLPLFFALQSRPVLIVGGGRVAWRKACQLHAAGARLTVLAPDICPEIRDLPGVVCRSKRFAPDDVTEEFTLVVVATDNPEVQRGAAERCRSLRLPVNVCDDPEGSDFVTGSLYEHDPLVIGINSSGLPGISRLVKERVARAVEPAIAELAALLLDLRPLVQERMSEIADREAFWRRWTTEESVARLRAVGREALRKEMLQCLSR